MDYLAFMSRKEIEECHGMLSKAQGKLRDYRQIRYAGDHVGTAPTDEIADRLDR